MSDGTNVIYRYDGSFEGLLTCIFTAFERKEFPDDITCAEEEQLSFSETREILTDDEKAERVKKSLREKVHPDEVNGIRRCWLSCREGREILILKYISKALYHGNKVHTMLADDTVNEMFRVVRNHSNESNFFREFLRFSEHNGVLVSVIEPENFVLPYIASHYCDRLKNESFFIFDKTHGYALVYSCGRREIIPVEDFVPPPPDETETEYRRMWKAFYNTVAIKERYNPKCRMTHMPKRYWKHLTEFEDEYRLPKSFAEATRYREVDEKSKTHLEIRWQ